VKALGTVGRPWQGACAPLHPATAARVSARQMLESQSRRPETRQALRCKAILDVTLNEIDAFVPLDLALRWWATTAKP